MKDELVIVEGEGGQGMSAQAMQFAKILDTKLWGGNQDDYY